MEETISIQDIFKTLTKRWKLIMLLTLIAALISGSISYFLLTPVYQTSTQILVNQKQSNNQLDYTQIRSNIDMINTYSVIIKSPAILEKVIDDLELEQNVDQLSQKITINSQENSQVFSLTVQDSNPTKAVEIANAVSGTFQKEIKDIMNVDNVSILAKAEVKENPAPVKPSPLLNIAIAVVVGFMAGIGLAFLLEYMDNTIRDEKDIETLLDLPLLGSIQKISQHK
ncbi:Wzz/FepE/Etk N-terminal domain-containing protein [Peribacillus simplex]|uniref:Wzz/FepE/Etk N-terminal domain-containing protein n=2 Tax=Peribacillus TaxID=2675229 RepID=A0AA90P8X3_9BACI|nr:MULTISPECIES: Wzz/FepE/Etk N-terminal domain-containing protein [Peribacillus]MDP1417441.1 Wzz/FepE/Etk N-terminal domain-containing protein [Peribacillus simplex]MDP1450096.1 Wzz/FepE/Etk N-terminal domain-containing protein [Peribacillus frigoritolerans]